MPLVIEGAVAHPQTLAFGELLQLAGQVEDVSKLIAGREGGAVRLAAVLERAGVGGDATHLTIESEDGLFAASLPLDTLDDAVLVYRLGGRPLPPENGGPLRLLVPDAARCGRAEVDTCANVKFVARLTLTVGRGRDTRPTTREEHKQVHGRGRRPR